MAGIEVERSIIVDSSPYLVLVSESITNTFSLLKPAFTCLCEVGLKYPDLLALGAAIGTPLWVIKSRATL